MSLEPYNWKDRPSLIEKIFPVQKLSVESFKEQMAGSGKTLTSLGNYWKGRKPLVLNKACILGCLLPSSDNGLMDLEVFETLMGMDDDSMILRLEQKNNKISQDIIEQFRANPKSLKYRELSKIALRYEECNPQIFSHIWSIVNSHLGTSAKSMPELINQMGIARFGRNPIVADVFSGSGQIPFEAARLGCDVLACDINPVACLLTWGSLNLVGAAPEAYEKTKHDQENLISTVDEELKVLGVESDGNGSRGKVYLYCTEVICPESGWKVPLLPTLIVSGGYKVVADLVPDNKTKTYDINIRYVESDIELLQAKAGTVQKGELVHSPDGTTIYRVKISTIRGDYKESSDKKNRLRLWEKLDITPRSDDIFQERLFCIQWMKKKQNSLQFDYEFRSVTEDDIKREQLVIDYVRKNLSTWQKKGWVPDMVIEKGDETERLYRERGWTHWHHLFNPRQLLLNGLINKHVSTAAAAVYLCRALNVNSRLSFWHRTDGGGGSVSAVFTNQALNTYYDYGCRGFGYLSPTIRHDCNNYPINNRSTITNQITSEFSGDADLFITDPPYGDAVKYEEITEFFIAWLQKNNLKEFTDWTWDSRRALAIKGEGEDFRQGMIRAYKSLANQMPDNGVQVLMFTHKCGSIWADMTNIVWASGLCVTAAWYVVTETSSALRQGANVTGTILLVLRKRSERLETFRDDLAWEIKDHVKEQMDRLTGLDKSVRNQSSEGLYNDADLQMAGYAAALKVLTTYSVIDGKDMEVKAKAPRQKDVKGFVDRMIEFAIQNTVEYLVPSSFDKDEWKKLTSIERYYLKMIDMEALGEKSLDNYQNFAKAFKIRRFEDLMGVSRANSSRLKVAAEFKSSLMSGDAEIAESLLRALLYAMWETQKNIEMDEVLSHLMDNCGAHYLQSRHLLITMAQHIADRREGLKPTKLYEAEASTARVLSEAIQGHRL